MINTLINYPRVLSRHSDRPLAAERSTFQLHLASQRAPRLTLLRYARKLRVIACSLDKRRTGPFPIGELAHCAKRWAQRQKKQGRAQSLKWPVAGSHSPWPDPL